MIAGTLPVSEFFSEANLGRILAGAGWQAIRRAAELTSALVGEVLRAAPACGW